MVLCKLYLGRGQNLLTQRFRHIEGDTESVRGGCSVNKKIRRCHNRSLLLNSSFFFSYSFLFLVRFNTWNNYIIWHHLVNKLWPIFCPLFGCFKANLSYFYNVNVYHPILFRVALSDPLVTGNPVCESQSLPNSWDW